MIDQDAFIEKKIDGTLTSEEAQQFDHLCRVDPAFAQAYHRQRAMIALFQQHRKEALHRTLKKGYQTYRRRRTVRRYYGGAAAAVLLLLVGGWWVWPATHERLFAEYYHPYEAVIVRSEVATGTHRAAWCYSQQRYAEALPLLEEQQRSGEDWGYWTLLRGNAYLQQDSTALARAQFEQVATRSDTVYQPYGRWYTAMSYLKEGHVASARQTLQPIARQPGPFQHVATQLLNEL